MSGKQLYIPDKIKVGYVSRANTYTGKLAYVIYFDHKGVLRKEKSWEEWRDKKIDPTEYSNEPTDGFVLNKKVGGHSNGWNHRQTYARVYDPRGHEFEITVQNLLYILQECDCSKGKGLEGKFVYAWDKKDLILLPVGSADYKESKEFTGLQPSNIKAKELLNGASYVTKDNKVLTYLGKFDYYNLIEPDYTYARQKDRAGKFRKHVSHDGKGLLYYDDVKHLATLNSDVVTSEYADFVDKFYKSQYGTKIAKLYTVPVNSEDHGWVYQEGECYYQFESFYGTRPESKNTIVLITSSQRNKFLNGFLKTESWQTYSCPDGTNRLDYSYSYYHRGNKVPWIEPTGLVLCAELESGSKFIVRSSYYLTELDKYYKAKETESGEKDN